MASRAEQKARTRDALIGSWLRIIGGGSNFAAVSLREVAKTAGVVPTSFYRHFDDMDDLGLAAVDELGLDLRQIVRGPFEPGATAEAVVAAVVAAFERYVIDHRDLVEFINQARTGGSPPLREAIGRELDSFAARLAGALGDVMPGLRATDRETVAQVVLAVLLESTAALLALPSSSGLRHDELIETLQRRLGLIVLGAGELAVPAGRSVAKPSARRTPARRSAS